MSFAASTAILRLSQETQETMHLFSHIRKPDEKHYGIHEIAQAMKKCDCKALPVAIVQLHAVCRWGEVDDAVGVAVDASTPAAEHHSLWHSHSDSSRRHPDPNAWHWHTAGELQQGTTPHTSTRREPMQSSLAAPVPSARNPRRRPRSAAPPHR